MGSKNKASNYCEIYEISVMVDDKLHNHFYIGQSWDGARTRFSRHKNDKAGHCVNLFNAMNKYGRENFSVRALLTVRTQEDADYYEDYFINQYDSIKNGYNIKEAGSHGKHSEATKQKLSESLKGKNAGEKNGMFGKAGKLNPMYGIRIVKREDGSYIKQPISEIEKILKKINKFYRNRSKQGRSMKGRLNPMFGRNHTDDVKQIISNKLKGNKNSLGCTRSEETKKKISEANTGNVCTKDHRDKISKGNSGKKRTVEQNKNQSIRMSGEGNHFYGQKQDLESIYKRKITRKNNDENKKLKNKLQILCSPDTIYKIYKIINVITNEYYINYTYFTADEIFNSHKDSREFFNRNLGARKLFYSFEKYGRDNFSIEFLSSTKCKDCAEYLKGQFIDIYNSINNGYNSK